MKDYKNSYNKRVSALYQKNVVRELKIDDEEEAADVEILIKDLLCLKGIKNFFAVNYCHSALIDMISYELKINAQIVLSNYDLFEKVTNLYKTYPKKIHYLKNVENLDNFANTVIYLKPDTTVDVNDLAVKFSTVEAIYVNGKHANVDPRLSVHLGGNIYRL